MGLWVGATFITLIEIFEFSFRLCGVCCKGKGNRNGAGRWRDADVEKTNPYPYQYSEKKLNSLDRPHGVYSDRHYKHNDYGRR